VHAEIRVLLDTIVEAIRFPGIGEEHQRDGLAKAVQLETTRANGIHDGGVVDDLGGDAQRAGA
jgi:hypothetical protein